ncbi:MAG TPA: hypothetical protein VJ826_03140 [Candidatus Polarisedimenticolaceae bacterium]|nr:hypothetical protein [Candidatus Polarisedimenticolaceae bacterium]
MLEIFPFLPWLATGIALFFGVMLGLSGELAGRRALVVAVWFVVAFYLQCYGSSTALTVVGLILQTLLTVYLWALWRMRP